MHEYNEFDVAGQALASADWAFSSLLHAAEVDTVFDYRWAREGLREKLLELRDTSLLTGQIVEVDTGDRARCIDYSTHESDYTGTSRVIGTFEGFYIEKTVFRDRETINAALPYIDEDDLGKMDRMPLHGRDQLELQLGIRLKPIVPIPGTDPDKTFVEIPLSEVEEIRFPEQDHPLIEEETLMLEIVSILMTADAAFGTSRSVDEVFLETAKKRNKDSAVIGRNMVLLVEEGARSFEANLGGSNLPIDVPVLKRVAGKLIGLIADIDDPEIGAEPLAVIKEETGQIVRVPLSAIAEGAYLDQKDTEHDQGLFGRTSDFFNEQVRHIIDQNPFDHDGIYEYLYDVCNSMNNGNDLNIHQVVALQTLRYIPFEISSADYSDPDVELGESDFEEVHDVTLGESFSLEGVLVGYRFTILECDEDEPLNEHDVQLIAIISPGPESTLLNLLGAVSVLVPVDAIKNARLGVANYN